MQSYSLCIVGAGITGLSLLLLLQDAGADLSKVVIVDPCFDGGDLARKWTRVVSNTPWEKTIAALARNCPSVPLPAAATQRDASQTTPLVEIAHLVRETAAPALRRVRQIQGVATRAEWAGGTWNLVVQSAGKGVAIAAAGLVLATGAEPRAMDLPIPSIPLEIALDSERLRAYLGPTAVAAQKRVIVFGTMHSGTLVLRNLVRECGVGAVVGLYNTQTPFVWDRDGAYDGLKAEAAEIADAITAGQFAGALELVNTADTSQLIRATQAADWVVYAMGFAPRQTLSFVVSGEQRGAAIKHDGATGALDGLPQAWGFGTAYPNRAPDGVHWDVSVAAFLDHMKPQLSSILATITRER